MQFTADLIIVIGLVFAILGGLVLWKIGPARLSSFLRTKDGKGVAKGVILAPAIIIAIGLVMFLLTPKAQAQVIPGTWFNDASVFMGIDRTKKISPQCQSGAYDDRSTSNMGFRLNVWQSPSRNIRLNSKYTHHSCALNPDRNSYDALGVELEWYIWNRYAR